MYKDTMNTQNAFAPGQPILVRNYSLMPWSLSYYSHYSNGYFVAINNKAWDYVIPYEGNEHLLGTTQDC